VRTPDRTREPVRVDHEIADEKLVRTACGGDVLEELITDEEVLPHSPLAHDWLDLGAGDLAAAQVSRTIAVRRSQDPA
jgi:hypothetical protein